MPHLQRRLWKWPTSRAFAVVQRGVCSGITTPLICMSHMKTQTKTWDLKRAATQNHSKKTLTAFCKDLTGNQVRPGRFLQRLPSPEVLVVAFDRWLLTAVWFLPWTPAPLPHCRLEISIQPFEVREHFSQEWDQKAARYSLQDYDFHILQALISSQGNPFTQRAPLRPLESRSCHVCPPERSSSWRWAQSVVKLGLHDRSNSPAAWKCGSFWCCGRVSEFVQEPRKGHAKYFQTKIWDLCSNRTSISCSVFGFCRRSQSKFS